MWSSSCGCRHRDSLTDDASIKSSSSRLAVPVVVAVVVRQIMPTAAANISGTCTNSSSTNSSVDLKVTSSYSGRPSVASKSKRNKQVSPNEKKRNVELIDIDNDLYVIEGPMSKQLRGTLRPLLTSSSSTSFHTSYSIY